MICENLQEFVALLERNNELIRVKVSVNPYLEITEITERMAKSPGGGKALLFEKVQGSDFSVLTNAFGSKKRLFLAFGGQTPDEIGKRLAQLLRRRPPETLLEKWQMLKAARGVNQFIPRKKTKRVPCQEIVLKENEVDLYRLPILHCWPKDAGPFITLPLVFTKSLSSPWTNVGMYRLQVFDKNTLGMHWHIHKDGAHIFSEYEKAGKLMEVAVAIGCDPVLTYAATSPLMPGMDEFFLAGFIRRKPVKIVPATGVNLFVPAEAEFILEGYIDPKESRLEGPFGDHTGYYTPADYYPVFHVKTITHRRKAIYATTVVGRPPMEDCYLGYATERIFLPLIQLLLPEIKDYRFPWEGVFHNLVIVAINKTYPGQAAKVMHGLWGLGQLSHTKIICVVDGETDLNDSVSLMKRILSSIDLEEDLYFTKGNLDALDHAANWPCFGGKLGIDATERLTTEPPRKNKNVKVESCLDKLSLMDNCFREVKVLFSDLPLAVYLFRVKKGEGKELHKMREVFWEKGIIKKGIVVFLDEEVNLADASYLLWKILGNIDPIRDISLKGNVLFVDATKKTSFNGYLRSWPEEVQGDPVVSRRVEAKLAEMSIPYLSGIGVK